MKNKQYIVVFSDFRPRYETWGNDGVVVPCTSWPMMCCDEEGVEHFSFKVEASDAGYAALREFGAGVSFAVYRKVK